MLSFDIKKNRNNHGKGNKTKTTVILKIKYVNGYLHTKVHNYFIVLITFIIIVI